MKDNFYITTTLPYVNADPHIGFALEIVQADVLARHHRSLGKKVFFNTGTDEHGVKIYNKAKEEGRDVQEYVDDFAGRFDKLKSALSLSYDAFIRTTDEKHVKAAQEFWKKCDENGDIYKKQYKVKYCVGCELEKTDSELDEDGYCPIHPNQDLEEIEEENYFFKFSNYQKPLMEFYEKNPDFVTPSYRFNEIKSFVERGLQDFSISRLKEKMPWGVPVPGDESQVMYVWFDALVNYISTLDWPDGENFKDFWPGVQVAGKDNLRQQSAMWQAMLMSAGIENSKQIMIHGFITSGGQKMSKSVGNVINPFDLIEEYGTDALRYFLLRHIHQFEDSDFTNERFKESYNANLANGLGNLVSRVLKMSESYLDAPVECPEHQMEDEQKHCEIIDRYNFNEALNKIWSEISEIDSYIQKEEPFKKIKVDEVGAKEDVQHMVHGLWHIAFLLEPLMPETAEKIKTAIKENKKPETLFERKG